MIKYTSYCRQCSHFKHDYYFSPTCTDCFWTSTSSLPTKYTPVCSISYSDHIQYKEQEKKGKDCYAIDK